ncbi:hypothetical protein WA158_007768 [Blastocystis sp. Blastoise]
MSGRNFNDWYKNQQTDENPKPVAATNSWFKNPLRSSDDITDVESQGLMGSISGVGKKVTEMKDKMKEFILCIGISAVFFLLAYFIGLPTLLVRPAKFGISFTAGSLLGLASFAILYGPQEYLKKLFSQDQIISTIAYFGSLFFSLYFAIYAKSYIGTLISTVVQILVLLYYTIQAFPAGSAFTTLIIAIIKKSFSVFLSVIKKCF